MASQPAPAGAHSDGNDRRGALLALVSDLPREQRGRGLQAPPRAQLLARARRGKQDAANLPAPGRDADAWTPCPPTPSAADAAAGRAGGGGAQAVPRLDLTPYPKPAAGEKRWVIQLPGVLPPTQDPSLSPNPADWRVELIVGKELMVDCNGPRLNGRIRRSATAAGSLPYYRVTQVSPPLSTRMACPADRGPRPGFVAMGSKPFVVPYNVSQPIVIYAPEALQVRWRLWKAERQQRAANAL